jgi:hypothetical protein
MENFYRIILTLSVLLVSCVACSPTDNNTGAIEATPTLITLEENLGGIKGVYQSNMQDNDCICCPLFG